jgi:hypothetical protein
MDDKDTEKDITAPRSATHEAGAPPSSPEADRDDVDRARTSSARPGRGIETGWRLAPSLAAARSERQALRGRGVEPPRARLWSYSA